MTNAFVFSDAVSIRANQQSVYERLWEVERWPQLLPHVCAVEVCERGPRHQRFIMTTRGEGGEHSSESVRTGFPFHKIEYEQLRTAAPLRAHIGRWLFEASGGGVRVTSEHSVEIEPSLIAQALGREYSVADAAVLVRHFIGNHSLKTLSIVREALEARDPRGAGART